MQASAFFTCHGLLDDQISYINNIAQFAYLPSHDRTLEKIFRLTIKYFQSVQSLFSDADWNALFPHKPT